MTAEHWQFLIQGVGMTLWLTATSALLSLAVGIVLGVLSTTPAPPLRAVAAGYTEFFRNIPLLTVLFFVYFGVPVAMRKIGLPQIDPVTSAIIALGLYTGAYVGEVIRAGLGTVSKGNIEAARSLGLSFIQMIRYVQLPQALRVAIPPLGTLLIALLKNTSLASTISVADLLFQSQLVGSRSFNPDILLLAGAIYVALTLPTGVLVNVVERRWAIQR